MRGASPSSTNLNILEGSTSSPFYPSQDLGPESISSRSRMSPWQEEAKARVLSKASPKGLLRVCDCHCARPRPAALRPVHSLKGEVSGLPGTGCLRPPVPALPPRLALPQGAACSLAAGRGRAATHRFLGMVPGSCAAGGAGGAAVAAAAALRALHSLVLGASRGRPSRWPERTLSLRPARSRPGARSAADPEPALAPVSPAAAAAASAMASALCRRPGPLGAGERSLRTAPGATIRCGASRQPPRRLGGGCHAPGALHSPLPPTPARPPASAATPRTMCTCPAGEFELSPDWPSSGCAGPGPKPKTPPSCPRTQGSALGLGSSLWGQKPRIERRGRCY